MVASYKLPAGLILICFMVATAMSRVPTAEAQTGLSSIININGTVLCAVNASLTTVASAFSNATVELKCVGAVVGTAITSPTGSFGISLGLLENTLSQILNSCNLVVATPLAKCNVTLPTADAGGILTSALSYVNTTITNAGGIIFNFVPTLFGI